MFKKDLERRLKAIFGFEKVSFNAPEKFAMEQDTMFVEVDLVRPRPYGKDKISCRVSGKLVVYSQDERMPYGFFSKRVEQANHDDTKPFFFDREIDAGEPRYQNIHERQLDFMFLYDTQYDPDRGSLTEINLSLEIGE